MMNAYTNYLAKQKRKPNLSILPFCPISVIIPCYDEPNILPTLEALQKCTESYQKGVHIIIVINHSEDSPDAVKRQNTKTINEIREWNDKYATLLHTVSVLEEIFPKNTGGVGDARKIGMDEAIIQYAHYEKEGIIVSLDADTLCMPNYLSEIYSHFQKYPKTNTLIAEYEHPLENLPAEQKTAMVQYELYLRYMRMAYEYVGHPHYFHTIGSAFTVRASSYCKQGGMNHRQAGEDFYFLQKMFTLGENYLLQSAKVLPSPRLSNRVPFGTGKAVAEIIENKQELQTYNFHAFNELKTFFDQHTTLYKITKEEYEDLVFNNLGGLIKSYLIAIDFHTALEKINANCASPKMFSKKFFETFSIFQTIKYLNFSHTHFIQKVGIFHAINCLPQSEKWGFSNPENLLESVRDELIT